LAVSQGFKNTLPDLRAKTGIAMLAAIIAECIIVAMILERLGGYQTPLAYLADIVLAIVIVFEILLMTGGLREREDVRILPYVES